MQALPIGADRIPDFRRLSDVLSRRTGWQVVAVPGLVPDEVFFEHLANRRFPAGQFIRKPQQLDYIEEPDVFHDVFGHVPMLMQPGARRLHPGLRRRRAARRPARPARPAGARLLVHGRVRAAQAGRRAAHLRRGHRLVAHRDGVRARRARRRTASPSTSRASCARAIASTTSSRATSSFPTSTICSELAAVDFGPVYERVRGLPDLDPGGVEPGDEVIWHGSGAYHAAGRRGTHGLTPGTAARQRPIPAAGPLRRLARGAAPCAESGRIDRCHFRRNMPMPDQQPAARPARPRFPHRPPSPAASGPTRTFPPPARSTTAIRPGRSEASRQVRRCARPPAATPWRSVPGEARPLRMRIRNVPSGRRRLRSRRAAGSGTRRRRSGMARGAVTCPMAPVPHCATACAGRARPTDGARGRNRTGTAARPGDFPAASAFAAGAASRPRRSWSGARLHHRLAALGARRLLSTPSRGVQRAWLGVSSAACAARAFADFDGCHLRRFHRRAQFASSPLCLPVSPPGQRANGCRQRCMQPQKSGSVEPLGTPSDLVPIRQARKDGGAGRSRTDLHGFAIRCITALLPRLREHVHRRAKRRRKREAWASLFLRANWSGRRVSNSRPQPWQGCALPTELLPHLPTCQMLLLAVRRSPHYMHKNRSMESRARTFHGLRQLSA